MSCFSRFIQSYPSSRRYLSASVSPLSLPLEGQAAFIPGPMVTEALRISALPNGIRVVSVDKGGPVASVGVVFGHGSRDEPFAGATQMLSKSMFLSTKKRFNPVRLIRDLQHTASNGENLNRCINFRL